MINGIKLDENRRLIKRIEVGDVTFKLVYDSEWEEYIVEVWKGRNHMEKKDYFSGGKDSSHKRDAEMTMNKMAQDLQSGKWRI